MNGKFVADLWVGIMGIRDKSQEISTALAGQEKERQGQADLSSQPPPE